MKFVAILFGLLFALPALAQPTEATLEAGMRLYKTADGGANCEHCHYWSGRGWQHNQLYSTVPAGGPSLEGSKMTREQMIEMVSCGRFNTDGFIMPMYRGEAWSKEHLCWGQTAADIKPPFAKPLWGMRMLNAAEVEAVVDYIQAVYVPGMTLGWCRKYFPTSPKACDNMSLRP